MVDGNNQTRGYLTYDQEMAIFSNIAIELVELWRPSNITTLMRIYILAKPEWPNRLITELCTLIIIF